MRWQVSPEKYLQETNPSSFPEIFKSDSLSIAVLKNEIGEIKIAAALSLLVNDLVDFFSVGKTMSDKQVAQTVLLIMKNFYYLKLPDDIKFCFEKMKMGAYGKTYDRIDGNIILECLNIYSNDRADSAEVTQEDPDGIEFKVSGELLDKFKKVRQMLEKTLCKEEEFKKFKESRK